MRVVRVYHAGRDAAHRGRERALAARGVEVTLVVPSAWPESGAEPVLSQEAFELVELPVRRGGDVNRHTYADGNALRRLLEERRPDVLDVHEEPVSLAARQWLRAAGDLPVTMYTAQNVDKRFPPPFAQYESAAYRRVDALYPCSRQAASVAVGKGFTGHVEVLPLGVEAAFSPGEQSVQDAELRLGLIGRLVPEKGVRDAVRVLAAVSARRRARLLVVGEGPERAPAERLAAELGVRNAVEFMPWQPVSVLAALYRSLHLVLVPSTATSTWVEQFGRIIVEGQASGAVVAAYASGAIPEVLGTAGVLVPERAVDALAREVADVLEDADRYTGLRKAGLARAASATWDHVADQQLALYGRIGSRASARRPALPAAERRRAAQEEFGPPAELAGGVRRPFALPLLRRDAPWTRAAGSGFDKISGLLGR